MTSELALKQDGTLLGLKVRVVANLGAYLQAQRHSTPAHDGMAPGCYQIRHCHVEVVAVFTNTVSTGPYRGAGRPEAVLNIERLIDKAARDLGLDPAGHPAPKLHSAGAVPVPHGRERGIRFWRLREGARGSAASLRLRPDAPVPRCGAGAWRAGRGGRLDVCGAERRGRRKARGAWSAPARSRCSPVPAPTARDMRPSLRRWWPTSCASPWSTWRFATATRWRAAGRRHLRQPERGHGRWGLALATQRVIDKAGRSPRICSKRPPDIVQIEGGFAVAGVPDRNITWRQIAATAYGRPVPGLEPGLQETVFFDPGREAWGFGACGAGAH